MADIAGAADQLRFFNRSSKVEAETKVNTADIGFLLSRIPPFNGSGYEIWSIMMKTMFMSQDLWDLVEGGYDEEGLTVEELLYLRKKDATALFFIQQALDKSVFSCIANARKSKEAWDALQKKYNGNEEQSNPMKLEDESVRSCPADATESKEATWDALDQGYQCNAKVMEANITSEEFGDFNTNFGFKDWCSGDSSSGGRDDNSLFEDGIGKELGDSNNSSVSKIGSKGNSSRRGRGCRNGGRVKNNRGGRGGEPANKHASYGSVDNNELLNNHGSRGGHGGKDQKHFNNNHGGCKGVNHESFKLKQGNFEGIIDGFFNPKDEHGGIDGGCINDNHSELGDYNGKNTKLEPLASCSANAIKLREAPYAQEQQHGTTIEDLNSAAHGQVQPQQAGSTSDGANPVHQRPTKSSVRKQERAVAGENTTFFPNKVFVGNLSEATTEDDLRNVFSCFGGTFSRIIIPKDGDGKSKCFGFVHFKDADDAAWSVEVLNGHKFDNKKWNVTRALKNRSAARTKKKSVDESALSSTDSCTKSEKSVDESSAQSSTASATSSMKSLDEALLSSAVNVSTKSKKAGKTSQKGHKKNSAAATVQCT